ncbi:MAG TPA: OmpA family protein [Cyclobacteriaceae bacterium]|nr:OmpA family protein [Cyclobacteriaceae bacterium]
MYSIRCVLIFLAVAGSFSFSFGQEDKKQQALDYIAAAEDMKAASMALDDIRGIYELAAAADPDNVKANFEAGHYRLRTIGKDLAVPYFLRVYELDPNYKFDLEYWIGLSYQYGLQFDKAIDFYNRYTEKFNARPNYQGAKASLADTDRRIAECEKGKELVSNPHGYSIVNIGSQVNSEYDDYGPVINEDETELIFTSRRRDGNSNQDVADDNKPYEEIFISRKENGAWAQATALAEVNSASHESTLALSADGNTLFIYKDENRGDVYVSEKKGNAWSEPVPLPGLINSSYEENSVTISRDEKTLYFSSNRPGGFGGLDIYSATLDSNGEWTGVKNLGPKINTNGDEDGPFIDHDGKTLYFSSKGLDGMGGFDIFKSAYDGTEWSAPENMGYPVNTPDNDIFIFLTKDGKRGYYASVREDAIGYDDIYMVTLVEDPSVVTKQPEPVKEPEKEPVVVVPPVKEPVKEPAKPILAMRYVVQVVDAAGKQPLDAKVKLSGLRDNVIVGAKIIGRGAYEFNINTSGSKDYRLSVEAGGYMFVNQTVKLDGASEEEKVVNRIVEMQKLTPGMVSILRNVYFDFDKWSFKDETYNELNKLERMMQENLNMKVEIGGHTDVVGRKNYNIFLSRKRAEAVKDFLTKKGIDPRRIKVVGYGASKPLASNDDEDEGRELNRRVEFKVTGN